MRTVLAFALVLMLSSLAISAPESSQLGPYAVTFDMNTEMQYEVIPLEAAEADAAAFYGLLVKTDNSTWARVDITENKELIDSTIAPQKIITALNAAISGFNVTSVEDAVIDGKEGYVASGVPFPQITSIPADARIFEAVYWLDSEKCECGPVSVGTTRVAISSTYPEDVTMNMINSLKIVKGEAAAVAGEQVLPPE
ncbi:MAG: hypothetical protein M0Q47_12205 [Methanothrix sp.]|uniref:hypothetical protein n=1 Tax=Methanothrix sp. TaxID=90426 RepID=UPI0025EF0E26|nr:hypothetical protein [Methanothrix sp.]MCK9407156.1 hypothetical protein [Methanothrix sp.]